MSLDDLQAQLRGALDQQFAALKQHHEQSLAEARRQAAVESATRLEAARAQWEAGAAAMLDAARTEARQDAEAQARAHRQALEQELQQQLEQSVQHAVQSVRRTTELEIESLRRRVEQDVAAERQRGQQALEEERRRGQEAVEEAQGNAAAELEAVKQLLEAEIASAQAEAAAAREAAASTAAALASARNDAEAAQADRATARAEAAAARDAAAQASAAAAAHASAAAAAAAKAVAPSAPASLARLPEAVRALDATTSLSQTLESLLQHAAAIAGRAAIFLINGDRLQSWKTLGIPEIDVQTVESSIAGRDLLARAIQAGQATAASADLPAPPFARLAGGKAVAVPLLIHARAVAVLYADAGGDAGSDSWAEAVDLIVRHASAVAAVRSAIRTLDVLRGGAPDLSAAGNGNGDESARRYARLLVSEIKLYNEAAVRAGRQQRDLRQRLRGEIDRALRLYEERVPAAIGARDQYFQQELVQTLADGDPSLLGH